MTNSSEQANFIEWENLNMSPNIKKLTNSGKTDLSLRLLKDIPQSSITKNTWYQVSLIFWNIDLSNDFKLNNQEIFEKIKKNIGYETLTNSAILQNMHSILDDLQDVYSKMNQKLGDLDTHSWIDAFNSDIIAIYRQVLTTPLSEIEAQVDMQITTIASNSMMHSVMLQQQAKLPHEAEMISAMIDQVLEGKK